jgi:hypothetical protein
MTARDFRRIALRLPQVTELAHRGHPDFAWRNRASKRLAASCA